MIDIICITGQTCAGKNTMFNQIHDILINMGKNPAILHHVFDRPPRIGDNNDPVSDYISKNLYDQYKENGCFWEEEEYEVSISENRKDIWRYATMKPSSHFDTYITIADVGQVKKYVELSKDTQFNIIAIVCECDDFIRLSRYAMREKENNGNIHEVLRRFKSDLENRDTKEIQKLGIPLFPLDTGSTDIGVQLARLAINFERGWI